jgi:hypothetical protein
MEMQVGKTKIYKKYVGIALSFSILGASTTLTFSVANVDPRKEAASAFPGKAE